MVPGHPRALLRMLSPRRNRDHGYAASIAGELYGGSVRDDPTLARAMLRATTRMIGAMATSCWPPSAGPASPCCRWCVSPP
jgi:hypothetical protein